MSKTGIDFVIGGTDNAKPAMSSVEKSLKRIADSTDEVAEATNRLQGLTKVLSVAYAALEASLGIVNHFDALNEAYDTQASAANGLTTALRLQGAEQEKQSDSLQQFASQLQALSGVGDEATLGLMKQASMLGVHADQLDDAAKATIGLAEATGKSHEEALRAVTQALQGEFGMFAEVLPQMREMQTEEEKLAAVLDLSTRGLEAKVAASNSVAGSSGRASGAIGDLMESVGALIAPFRVLINNGLKTAAEALQQVLAPAVDFATEKLANIGPWVEWVQELTVKGVNKIVEAWTFLEVILTNLDQVWAMVVASAELALVQMVEAVKHALTVTIPAYAEWFGENFFNLIRDAFMLAYTVISNHVKKIIDVLAALWDFIASGGSSDVLGRLGEIAGRSYLDGFESSLTALPEIATRKLTEREQQLKDSLQQTATNLADQFSQKMSERVVSLSDLAVGDIDASIDLDAKLKNVLGGGGSGGGAGNQSASESRLLTRGPGSDFMKVESLLQQMVSELKEIKTNSRQRTRLVPAL